MHSPVGANQLSQPLSVQPVPLRRQMMAVRWQDKPIESSLISTEYPMHVNESNSVRAHTLNRLSKDPVIVLNAVLKSRRVCFDCSICWGDIYDQSQVSIGDCL